MATPDEFRAAFTKRGVIVFPVAAVAPLSIGASDADWLTKVGLPRSAAPFLGFGGKLEINIPTVTELWGVKGGSRYRVIGSNGSGDPIAIDTATSGEVVYLNHDNAFQRVFINSSVTMLAESLLSYHRLISEAQAANGPEAYLDGNVPPETIQRFAALITSLDPAALVSGMWVEELDQLKGRADAG